MIATAAPKTAAPYVVKMTITPAMAANWLENANTRNRPISDAVVARYARDMKGGHWQLSHQGIAFDPHGVLLDGQQRLWAVVEANVPVEMYVWFNLSPDTLMIIDGGHSRSLVDHLRLGGGLGSVSREQVSVLRCMLGQGLDVSLTADEAGQQFRRHERAILFAMEHLPTVRSTRGITTADTRAVVARAWYSAPADKLADFCNTLRRSIARRDIHESVIVLRSYLCSTPLRDRCDRRERYRKTERVLLAFLRDEPIIRLTSTSAELFPLPNEIHSN
jgi:hypothetical protein